MKGWMAVGMAAVSLTAAAVDEPITGTILPLVSIPVPVTEECISNTVKQIREVAERSGIRKVALGGPGHSVRVSGMLPVEKYRELGQGFAAIKAILAKDGVEVCYRMAPTVNVGANHPWRHYTWESGEERAFTACPADVGFRKEFARQCAAVAGEMRPFLYMMEDDFRYWGSGCFCPEHVAAISAAEGVQFTRESLLKALRDHESPKSARLRMRWAKMQEDSLVALATAAEQAIHAVSPETRVALSAPGMLMDTTTEAIARALAGPGRRPLVRWWGAIYGTDYPLDLTDILFHARWAKENVAEGIDCFYEADPCPRNAYFASGARMSAMCSTVSAFGFDGFWFWGADPGGISKTPQYLREQQEQAGRFAAIRAEAKTGKLAGVSVPMNMQARVLWQCGIPSWARPLDESAGARLLNRLGIPLTTRPGAVALYSGHWAFEGMSDEEVKRILSGGVILDGAAAEALTWRGFAELMGVKAEERDRIDFTNEQYVESGFIAECSFHVNYGLDDCRVSRLTAEGAEPLSYYFDTTPERRVQPSVTRYRNRLGGRVAVIAVNLANAKTPNLYNQAKCELLVQTIRWIGGEEVLPVCVVEEANVMVVASENAEAGRLMVHALNLSCDTCRGITFEVSERYRNAAVEVLEGEEWRKVEVVREGRKLRVPCELAVYRTLVCRLKK